MTTVLTLSLQRSNSTLPHYQNLSVAFLSHSHSERHKKPKKKTSMDFPNLDQDFPNLDQDFPSYEAVESIISSIDSRLFVIFPSQFYPIFYYNCPFSESLFISYFFFRFFLVSLVLGFISSFFVFCFLLLVSSIPLSLSPRLLNIVLNFQFLPFLPLFLFLQPFVTFFSLKLLVEFQFVPFRLKTADLLFLGRDDAYKRSVISALSVKDEVLSSFF